MLPAVLYYRQLFFLTNLCQVVSVPYFAYRRRRRFLRHIDDRSDLFSLEHHQLGGVRLLPAAKCYCVIAYVPGTTAHEPPGPFEKLWLWSPLV